MPWHEIALGVLISIASIFLSGGLALLFISRLPEDYFVNPQRQFLIYRGHPVLRVLLIAVKNLVAVVLIIGGIAMSLPGVPGQGLLTVLIGVILLDFPGKYRVERWLIRKRIVSKSVNWIRAKTGRPPLLLP